jgi:PAS domain-containing protein
VKVELARHTDDSVAPWCRAIADTVRDVIYCTRIDGTLEYVNAAFERLFTGQPFVAKRA